MNTASITTGNITTRHSWRWQDNIWALGLYGTAVGAGTLFLPVEIGTRGPVIFLIMLLLGLPLSLLPHLLLCRVYMREEETATGTLPIFGSFFSGRGEKLMTLFYCVTFFPVTLVYGVALVNAMDNFLTEHLHFTGISRGPLSFIVVAALYVVLSKGRDKVVATMSALALPFAASVLLIGVSLIPDWHLSNFTSAITEVKSTPLSTTMKGIWLTLPLITFSFCCAPMVSPLTSYYREKRAEGESKALFVIRVAYVAIFTSIIFFVLSCVLSIPHDSFVQAKAQNLNVLSVMKGNGDFSLIYYLAPFIAIIGMTKSFLGVGLSVAETFGQLAASVSGKKAATSKRVASLVLFLLTFGIVYANPDVINLIETFCGPLIAVILFLIPAYLIYTRAALAQLRGVTVFLVVLGGLATLSALLWPLI
ncbi:AAA family ATPase [Leclercia adecarboxylata]|uniref:AAA family ATPase n=2 Tax=Leclercia adecarboxylata TaxID=83655 RepID=A0A4U9HW69_9ENTR|nr:AAA family ATPase [Leclercia adecarboxylata]KFC99236.1 serine transporter [Leclercia adecarboxylata ATCC 23216 = NBRC 102595]MBD1403966.1 AAA family ATPase [Leclercia adecarboxylata]MCU6675980.1 AAA family ATPase [Leclercia adecarboxylata]MCV3302970.1 AAA family ATPase [Leclercia adecarboxylata]MCV3306675.1 AAA family ATPase [Leclercia adecarboxylata]